MRTKKLSVIIVSIVFVLVMLFSCIALFSVKAIEVNYAVGDNTSTKEIQEKLDEYLGENLLFLDEQEVFESLKEYHYMEVLSIEKSYPNVVRVDIRERREVYEIVSEGKVYVTTDNGYVLRTFDLTEKVDSRDRITLELEDVKVKSFNLGEVIVTDADELLAKVFEMAKSVQLTNCIKSVSLEKAQGINAKATFNTYTGVKILVRELFEQGVEKIETAFEKYEKTTDYQKTFEQIVVFVSEVTGQIEATFTPQGA